MIAPLWAVAGVLAVLVQAIVKLIPPALEPFRDGARAWVIALYAGSIVLNGWVEGWRAFHKKFSPRVAARALHLRGRPPLLHAVLAPLFAMAFFHARRRRLIANYVLLVGLVILIWAVRHSPQPWRGAIDAGVVLALAGGSLSIVWYFVQGLRGKRIPASAELPEP